MPAPAHDNPVLIAGAGIAGLALALALSRRGIAACVLERRSELSEAGAGIQLGPNAMRVLDRLGAAVHLESDAGRPEAILVADGPTGRALARLPLGRWIERRHGAPYWVAHRADLQAALLAAARGAQGLQIVSGFEVTGWQVDDDRIAVSSSDGRRAEGTALVGADGLWSAVRRHLFPDQPLSYAGKMAARTVIPMPRDLSRFAAPVTGVWLNRDAHAVHYPVRGGRDLAIVAIVDEATPREGWGGEIAALSVQARLVSFAAELMELIARGKEWHAWSLYDPPPLPAWSIRTVGLIGDAAHPILPFLAQGGAMALEDAETLAALLAAHPGDAARAFAAHEASRRARVLRVQEASRENGRTFHLQGPPAIARNLALAMAPGGLLMRRYDWLYGWKGAES